MFAVGCNLPFILFSFFFETRLEKPMYVKRQVQKVAGLGIFLHCIDEKQYENMMVISTAVPSHISGLFVYDVSDTVVSTV